MVSPYKENYAAVKKRSENACNNDGKGYSRLLTEKVRIYYILYCTLRKETVTIYVYTFLDDIKKC